MRFLITTLSAAVLAITALTGLKQLTGRRVVITQHLRLYTPLVEPSEN